VPVLGHYLDEKHINILGLLLVDAGELTVSNGRAISSTSRWERSTDQIYEG
jgi:hypothetical protein